MEQHVGLAELLPTMEAAQRYRVSVYTLALWRKFKGFPEQAVVREGSGLLWNIACVDEWLRQRPISKVGRPPRWGTLIHGA